MKPHPSHLRTVTGIFRPLRNHHEQTSAYLLNPMQALFGLLLVGWPLLDTGPMGAVTPLRIGLGSGLLLLIAGAWVVGGRGKSSEFLPPSPKKGA